MARSITQPQVSRDQNVDVTACFIWAGTPLILIGPPGTTKSATCRAIFRSFGWEYRRKGIPGITDPILLSGLPDQDGDSSRTKPFPWLKDLLNETSKKKRTGLIFDDIAESSRLIQTSLLDVLGEKDLGGHVLPLTSMVATANPIGGGLQITSSMANRVGHLKWSITPKEQAALMANDFPNPKIPAFEENWEDRIPLARREISGFLATLQDFDAPDPDGATTSAVVGAYPSARTWECFAQVTAAVEASDMSEERKKSARILAAKALVGDVAATAFFTFLAYPDMPAPGRALGNPRLVLQHEELFRSDRPDRAYIFLNALTRYALSVNSGDAWKAAWEVFGLFADQGSVPVCAPFALVLHRRRPEDAPDSVPAMSQFEDVLHL